MSAISPYDDGVRYSSSVHEEVGFSVPDQYNASRILFDNLGEGRGNKIAVYSPSGNKTYKELCEQAGRIGNGLLDFGLKPGDRVLMMLDDTPVYPAALFGALRVGLVPVLVNTLSTPDLFAYFLEDSGAKIAMVDASFYSVVSKADFSGTNLQGIVVANGRSEGTLSVKSMTLLDWLEGIPEHLPEAPTDRSDMAFWMYSSGSTGRPKGVVHLHHDMAYTHACYGESVLQISDVDICYSPPKIFFAYGLGNSITFPFSAGASTVLIPGRPVPEVVLDFLERYRPTLFFGLPTLYTALLKSERSRGLDLSFIRLCLSAAEVLSKDVFETWKERHGHEIVEGLGSTEVLHIYLSNTPNKKRPGASGLRVPGYELKLLDSSGEPVADGNEGILWVCGDSSSPMYWNKPDKTSETMRDSWIYTGDRFVRDEEGFYFFQGRADDLIKVSGQWVYPLEIERCLSEHPAVWECAVFGIEMSDRRMTIQAFVSLKDGEIPGEGLVSDMQSFVKQRLLPYKYPRIIRFMDCLPKTGTDKIDRQKLLATAKQDLSPRA